MFTSIMIGLIVTGAVIIIGCNYAFPPSFITKFKRSPVDSRANGDDTSPSSPLVQGRFESNHSYNMRLIWHMLGEMDEMNRKTEQRLAKMRHAA